MELLISIVEVRWAFKLQSCSSKSYDFEQEMAKTYYPKKPVNSINWWRS